MLGEAEWKTRKTRIDTKLKKLSRWIVAYSLAVGINEAFLDSAGLCLSKCGLLVVAGMASDPMVSPLETLTISSDGAAYYFPP